MSSFNPTINHAVEVLYAGGLIAYPTEAVWGVGCDPKNEDALSALMSLKSRPSDKGVIVVASTIEQIMSVATLTQEQQQLIQTRSDRPTTWICPARADVSKLITGRFGTVAVRLSHHPVIKNLCDAFGAPIVSTSANPSGEIEAKSKGEAKAYFADKIAMYVDGNIGGADRPSRIIDIETMNILRD